jgi:glycosyltransferase involved in cell wall biosynthesis
MKQEIVSIILATQNREKFLPRALDSIAAQTYKDYTLYVIDDASTDTTMEIIEKYKDRIPSMVIHKNPKALGQCNSLVKMIEFSH